MKKTIIGAVLSLVGSLWSLALLFIAGNNPPDTWYTDLGKLWSYVVDLKLVLPFVLGVIIAVFGIIILLIELFRKEQ